MPTVPCLARLLPGLLGLWLACAAAHAQIHEEQPAPGLEEGILLDAEGGRISDEPSKTQLIKQVGAGDFSVVINTAIREPRELANVLLYADHAADAGWYLRLTPEGAVEFSGLKPGTREKVGFATPAHAVRPSAPVIIVASIKRDARQPLAGLWIDGVEIASAAIAPVDCTVPGSYVNANTGELKTLRVRVYNRALTRPEILELSLRSSRREEALTPGPAAPSNGQKSVPPHVGSYEFPKPKHPAPPPNGPRFIPQPDETIALIGGTEAVALAESGELEALLLMSFPQTRFHFRSLAWESDTVFKQDRPMNFGSLEQQLRRVNAGAVFVMFGRQECLEAKDEGGRRKDEKSEAAADSSLDSFKAAFEKLLATVAKVTPNIVVIGPTWFEFEQEGRPFPHLEMKTFELTKYLDLMANVAREHNATFIEPRDVMTHPREVTTRDGVNFTNYGTRFYARTIMWAMRAQPHKEDDPQINRALDAIRAKNRLWHDYWRPSNWAFLHGDRTNQPSSRDPVNPQVRFFPAEQEKYLPLIKGAEEKIFQLVQEAQKKLP